MKSIIFFSFIFVSTAAFCQPEFWTDTLKYSKNERIKDTTTTSPWKLKSVYTLNATQSSFVNWNAGGRNNVSLLGSFYGLAFYGQGRIAWNNELAIALGGLKYIEKESKQGLQKTEDRIDLSTKLGFELKKDYFISLVSGFRTQSLNGYSYPNDSVRVSTFLAPGYLSFALGVEYLRAEHLSIFLSPFASKMTIVKDQVLSNAGAYGVTPAVYDGLGNVVITGSHLRSEFGAYLRVVGATPLAKNIDLRGKLELFSNYTKNPQNVDLNAELKFMFKVNSWFAASLQWATIYDDDIRITDANGTIGPRLQFMSIIGLGITYKMTNFKD
ncbi:MAG: DUF3078 domain-containing protein [Flavobacteriia bacterium]|jgi:hypothetical protein